jgi:pilus assembly protein CpaF
MSLLKSFHEPVIDFGSVRNERHLDKEISGIIEELVEQHAELLADVESGRVARRVLETEVLRIVDRLGNLARRDRMIKQIYDHMFGYGKLQTILEDESVSDVIATRHDCIFVRREGLMERLSLQYDSARDFENFCKLIVIRNGGMINETDSHARVSDEALRLRINVTIPPRSVGGASLSIRKHRFQAYTLDDLEALHMVDSQSRVLIERLATSKKRFVIVGKGASGKTTLLRVIINLIGVSQRLLICESDSEIYPDSPTAVVQRIVKHRQPGHCVTLEHLVRDGLTMSLDGYCVGELVGEEAWEFIKAGFTDHRIMGTLHSGGVEETPLRILTLVDIGQKGISESTALRVIASSLDIIIYMKGFKVERISQMIKGDLWGNITPEFETLYERRA